MICILGHFQEFCLHPSTLKKKKRQQGLISNNLHLHNSGLVRQTVTQLNLRFKTNGNIPALTNVRGRREAVQTSRDWRQIAPVSCLSENTCTCRTPLQLLSERFALKALLETCTHVRQLIGHMRAHVWKFAPLDSAYGHEECAAIMAAIMRLS